MFVNFLYYLRGRGLRVSTTEWIALEEALETGLAHSSLTGFYYLCRAILVKTESEFDLFDDCFLEYFGNTDSSPEIPEELKKWLDRPELSMAEFDDQQAEMNSLLGAAEIEDMFQRRQKEQKTAHNKGTYWIGTHGMSVFEGQQYAVPMYVLAQQALAGGRVAEDKGQRPRAIGHQA